MSDLPSPLKSPRLWTCQAAPGLTPTLAPLTTLSPSISQTAAEPSVCCQKISARLSPSKSPDPIACQAVPGLNPAFAPLVRLTPSIDQIATAPLAFCHRNPDLPSPSKSVRAAD